MKNFDTQRFGHVLKLDFAEGRKAILWGALCMLLLYLFFFWFAHEIGYHNSRFDYVNDPDEALLMRITTICEAVGIFSAMAMYVFFLITASTLYRAEQKKQQRIAWLMLPATNLEKFLSRWVYLLVFSLVGGLLTFFVADLVHIAYLSTTDYPVQSATDDFFNLFPHTRRGESGGYTGDHPWIVTIQYVSLMAAHAFFLLCGVLFKRFHFIAASAVLVVVTCILIAAANMVGYRDVPAATDYELYMSYIIWMVIYACATVLFTWLAYRLFCRWQLVTHKFVNL